MGNHFSALLEHTAAFMPHGHCYLWIPELLWLHVGSDFLIGAAYVGIALLLWLLVRTLRLPFSPLFMAFGLFIALCGATHFMAIWTTWWPNYWLDGGIKAATAAASVATAIGLLHAQSRIKEFVRAARLSEERRIRLESTHAELQSLYQQVKDLSEARSHFFANVSHELRTPLALILGPTSQLMQNEALAEHRPKELQTIKDNAEVLLRYVNDLLDVAKIESNALRLRYSEVELQPWFNSVARRFDLAALSRSIEVSVNAPLDITAQFDKAQMERIVTNLVSNALRFTPNEGKIAINVQASDDRLQFEIEDSGLGVAPSEREKVFERFKQSETDNLTRAHGGTGLGLSIVKELTELHHGSISVSDSALGGAKFSLGLPRWAPPGTAIHNDTNGATSSEQQEQISVASALAPTGSLPDSVGNAGQVLVVDDNHEMRRFISGLLHPEFSVVEAIEGEQALAIAQALVPDVILTDLMMPRMNGEQFVQQLRQHAALAHTPVLMLTARTDENTRIRLLNDGVNDYLLKPFMPDELRARIRNLVKVKRAADTLRDSLSSASTDLESLAHELALRERRLQSALNGAEVAREQAERASLAKSEFLALISHELRTPLATAQLNLQLFTLDNNAVLPEVVQIRVARALAATKQLQATIDGLLSYVQVESGRLNRHPEIVDVQLLAQQTVDEFQPTLEGKPVSLRCVAAADVPSQTETDPRLLKVILSNLISNAIKYTERGHIEVAIQAAGSDLQLTVTDTGIGIAEQDLERIFEPFQQLEPIARKSVPGVGIGLTLVKQLVRELGGHIEVTSQLNTGTKFFVTIPQAQRSV